MAVLLALAAAASWGASDFLGGVAGRRAAGEATVAISFVTQVIGLVGLVAVLAVLGRTPGATADLVYGALAGVGSAVGITALYRGLAVGRMAVVAPIAGAVGAAIPVVVGAATGGAPTSLAWAGVLATLLAIVLVSRETETDEVGTDAPGTDDTPRPGRRIPAGVAEGLLAGGGFASVFILLDHTASTSGLWPLVAMRGTTAVVLAVFAALTARPLRVRAEGTRRLLLAIGVLDVVAMVTYLLATHAGLLAIVAVVGSLYPVGTVLLAWGVLHERTSRHQLVGLALAVAGVVLISLG